MIGPIDPPPRLLMGPGPINADPRVLRAMSAQLVGQYDPSMTASMNETMALYREVFRTANEQTFLVDGTSRAGIEAALVSLVEPGDRVLVPVFGRFGHLLAEIAERCGAEVHTIEVPWGEVFTPEQVEAAVAACGRRCSPSSRATPPPRCASRWPTSARSAGATTCCSTATPPRRSAATRSRPTPGASTWSPPGCRSASAAVGQRADHRLAPRGRGDRRARHVEAGIRDGRRRRPTGAAGSPSNYLDLAMVMDYWGPRRLNHHTEATTMLYGARECARLLVDEGLDAAVERHALHGRDPLHRKLLVLQTEISGVSTERLVSEEAEHAQPILNAHDDRRALRWPVPVRDRWMSCRP